MNVFDVDVGALALHSQILLEDHLIDLFRGLVAVHLLHLEVHDDQFVNSISALASPLQLLLDQVDGNSPIRSLLYYLLDRIVTHEFLQFFLNHE